MLTASFADYLLPSATDFPNIRGQFMELALAPGNPLGAKGAGEGGIVAVAAAVSNAVSAALSSFGVQIRELAAVAAAALAAHSRFAKPSLDEQASMNGEPDEELR